MTGPKVVLAMTLLLSVLVLSACGQGQKLGPLLLEGGSSTNPGDPLIPHTVEGRNGFCLTCHIVDDVSIGDTSNLQDGGGIIKPGQTTHARLSELSCVFCHSPAWRTIKTTGLPKPVGIEDCESCHGVRPTGNPSH